MAKKSPVSTKNVGNNINCENCTFNSGMDDDQARCEFMKLMGKKDPTCSKYEPKA
ncbi:MAG TPA: hypothetical protein VKM55_15215 [Candidatus Lokiarchaeia archaeon]|nr:hypothetical protein [Candidatus Lokiarchaeia archaeon]